MCFCLWLSGFLVEWSKERRDCSSCGSFLSESLEFFVYFRGAPRVFRCCEYEGLVFTFECLMYKFDCEVNLHILFVVCFSVPVVDG